MVATGFGLRLDLLTKIEMKGVGETARREHNKSMEDKNLLHEFG
jgi:hypothetical protein